MSLPSLLQISLSSLLDSPAVVELAARAGDKAVVILKNHFTLSSKEINDAIQNSYGYALATVAAGLAAPEQKLAFLQKLSHSKLEREFADQIEINYLQPFLKNSSFFQPDSDPSEQGGMSADFRANAIKNCRVLIPYKKQLLQDAAAAALTEADLVAMISYKGPLILICFICILCKYYAKMLAALQEAYAINVWQYALHDVDKYPLVNILGAGGMGACFCVRINGAKLLLKRFGKGARGGEMRCLRSRLLCTIYKVRIRLSRWIVVL